MKKLTRHGNSYALVIDKPILELLRIEPDTPLELITNGDAILIQPIRNPDRQKRLRRELEEINRQFGSALRKLAE